MIFKILEHHTTKYMFHISTLDISFKISIVKFIFRSDLKLVYSKSFSIVMKEHTTYSSFSIFLNPHKLEKIHFLHCSNRYVKTVVLSSLAAADFYNRHMLTMVRFVKEHFHNTPTVIAPIHTSIHAHNRRTSTHKNTYTRRYIYI